MPVATEAATDVPTVFRRPVLFCVLPAELAKHHTELVSWFSDTPEVEVVLERRDGPDRRQVSAPAPEGAERRAGERRNEAASRTSALDMGLELPRTLRRHASEIACTWRQIPVHLSDAHAEADAMLDRAHAGEGPARDELRMRYHRRVHSSVSAVVPSRRRALDTTDAVFDEVFAHSDGGFEHSLSKALGQVLSN